MKACNDGIPNTGKRGRRVKQRPDLFQKNTPPITPFDERRDTAIKPYKTITLRLNAAEYAHLKGLSETTGLKMEPTLRKLVMGIQLRPRPPDTYAALLRELSAIGNNVNQIAHNTNIKKSADRADIDEAVALIRQAWRLVKDTL